MTQNARSAQSKDYRFGFNGKEKISQLSLYNYDFGARMYDSRIGRWLSIDPLAEKYTSMSPYLSMGGNPLVNIDSDGMQIVPRVSYDENNDPVITIVVTGKLINYAQKGNATNIASRISDIKKFG